jgi:FKBP-type peptidyl-prolyl cis-trans isomerase
MNTKSVIGIIVVIIIIVIIGIVLAKKPAAPVAPTTPVTDTTPAATTPSSPVQPAVTTTTTSATTTTAKPATTTTADGLKIEEVKAGTGAEIANGQTAEMLYTGTLANGTVFDSTASRGNTPFSFTLGAGQVIKGWDEGILGMKVGEERILTIPSALAYGAAGYPPVIPQNATLTFDVTLVGIK